MVGKKIYQGVWFFHGTLQFMKTFSLFN